MSVNFSFNSSLDPVLSVCFNSTASASVINSLYTTRLVLLVPISIFILHLGHEQWRQHRSLKTASHSDIFTYNLAVMELISSLVTVVYFLGIHLNTAAVGHFLISVIFFGETGFHTLTCMDRYLAVVHPVKYREVRSSRGVTVRNIGIVCVWMLLLLWTFGSNVYVPAVLLAQFFSVFVIFLAIVSFCSLSVLFALFRPGPGTGGRNGQEIDQSKQRAFFTVMAIMGVLCLFFLGFLASTAVVVSKVFCDTETFLVHFSLMWLSLPSSLVLPLLFLHKAGKLPCRHSLQK